MRKVFKAGVAGLIVGGGVPAAAQTADLPASFTQASFTQGQVPTRPSSKPPAGANDGNNTGASAGSGSVRPPTPGTVVIHINGRVLTELNATWSSLDRGVFPTGGTPAAAGPYKLQPTNLSSYARIYTGLDAMAANGMRYGGAIEVRQNFTGQTSTATSTGASAYSSSETLFVRRAFAYVAADQVGILRAGQGDGLISLYDDGNTTFQFLPSTNLQGGDMLQVMPLNVTVPFAFLSGSGNEYANTKLVYMSPQIAGIDVGVQWAPNTSNGFGTGASATASTPGCPRASSGCPGLSSSGVAADGSRILNQTAVGIRYQGKAGPVGVVAYGVYEFSGHANHTGPVVATGSAAQLASSNGTGRFDDLSFGNAGIALSYAGLTVGGNWIGGAVNGQGALRPSGGTDLQGWLVGASYKQGPFTVGGSFESIDSQGAPQLVGISQRHEIGVDVGASYTVAPGLVAWVEYMYQQRHQGGFNFAAGSAVSTPSAYNDVKGQGLQLGTTVFW